MRIVRLDQVSQFAAINVLSDPGAISGPVVIPQAAQIVFTWGQDDGTASHNVLYGRYAGAFAGSVASANSIMTSLTTGAAWTAFNAFLFPNSSFFGVTIRDVGVANAPMVASTNAAVPGTSTGTSLPTEVAICVTLRTDRTGPRFRGRIYLQNFASNAVGTAGVIAPAAVTAINNWVATIGSAFLASGFTHVLGLRERAAYTSPLTGRVFPARAAETRTLTSIAVRDNHWDSQRRRGLK